MTTVGSSSRDKVSSQAPLSAQLGVSSIIFMVLAAAAPLSVVAGLGPVGIATGNGIGFPSTFILIALILLIFSIGFTAMTPYVRESGGFYSYIQAGLGFPAGVGATFMAVYAYVAMQVGMYPFAGLLISNFLGVFGLSVPWWVISGVLIATIGYLGYRNIDFSAKVLAVLLIAELVVVTIVSVAIVGQGGEEGLTLKPFTFDAVFSGNFALGLTFAVSSFMGFESTAVYRDEAKDPAKTIPRATYGAVLIVTVVYTLATWAFVEGWGSRAVSTALESMSAGNMYQMTAARYVGDWLALVINVLLVTSLLACILSWHNVTARYLFTNGRSGALPQFLGRQHMKHRSPGVASLATSLVIALLTLVVLITGLDPYGQVYSWFSAVGVIGVVFMMFVVSISTLMFFAKNKVLHDKIGIIVRLIAPLTSVVVLAVLVGLIIVNFPVLVGEVDAQGSPSPGPVTAVIFGVAVISVLIGCGWGWWLYAFRRNTLTVTQVDTNEVDEVTVSENHAGSVV
ncbi:APC family permease [Pseudomonas sp. Teo4]|uniref:APC family permease n=1 Tax=Pseudomonas sp. Teo4 TaxID=3064528 RepID=UPI002AB85F3F|nr:APC family permease [Pseudomonas sp. Teo4]MDZ3992591.1 hypothetical protein [Pseudomonas sp. Teo4]